MSKLIIEGDCENLTHKDIFCTCSKGTVGCNRYHRTYREGSKCRYCKTDGGYYVCPEADRGIFACSNYRGKY